MIQFTDEVNELIKEHNLCNAINSFLYHNPGCEEEISKLYPEIKRMDRFTFVNRKHTIECKLASYVHNNFDGKKVIFSNGQIGTISHPLTRIFNNMEYTNGACFRWLSGVGAVENETMKIHDESIAVDVIVEGGSGRLYLLSLLTLL